MKENLNKTGILNIQINKQFSIYTKWNIITENIYEKHKKMW